MKVTIVLDDETFDALVAKGWLVDEEEDRSE